MKKMLGLLLLGVAFSSLHGLQKTTIINQTNKNIQVLGYGLGCAGVAMGRALMCGNKAITIAPGKSKQIKYARKTAATMGGIRVLAMANGAMYDLKAPKKLTSPISFFLDSAQFKRISPDLRAEKQRILASKKMENLRKTKNFYFVAFAADKNGKIGQVAAGDMPLDGTLTIGVNPKTLQGIYAIERYQPGQASSK